MKKKHPESKIECPKENISEKDLFKNLESNDLFKNMNMDFLKPNQYTSNDLLKDLNTFNTTNK